MSNTKLEIQARKFDQAYGEADKIYDANDYVKAFFLFLKLAECGCHEAMSRVAIMYCFGEGVEKDVEKSIEWDLKALSLGSYTALNNLGVTYKLLGDFKKAKIYLKRSLAQNPSDGEAALALAELMIQLREEKASIIKLLNQACSSTYISLGGREDAIALLHQLNQA